MPGETRFPIFLFRFRVLSESLQPVDIEIQEVAHES